MTMVIPWAEERGGYNEDADDDNDDNDNDDDDDDDNDDDNGDDDTMSTLLVNITPAGLKWASIN